LELLQAKISCVVYGNDTRLGIDYRISKGRRKNIFKRGYLLFALSGSGKDAYIKRNLDQPVLSLDDIRRKHKISPTN